MAWWAARVWADLSTSRTRGALRLTAGGGMDYETPWFDHHLAIRIFQADYEYMHINWGPVSLARRGATSTPRA